MKKKITITPIRVADLLAEGERMPVYVHVIDHPDARVLIDTGMTELHPAAADLDPRLLPLSRQDFDIAGIACRMMRCNACMSLRLGSGWLVIYASICSCTFIRILIL